MSGTQLPGGPTLVGDADTRYGLLHPCRQQHEQQAACCFRGPYQLGTLSQLANVTFLINLRVCFGRIVSFTPVILINTWHLFHSTVITTTPVNDVST